MFYVVFDEAPKWIFQTNDAFFDESLQECLRKLERVFGPLLRDPKTNFPKFSIKENLDV